MRIGSILTVKGEVHRNLRRVSLQRCQALPCVENEAADYGFRVLTSSRAAAMGETPSRKAAESA